MKKFLSFMLIMISMVLSSIGATSCCNHSSKSSGFSKKDSLEIVKIVQKESASTFETKDMQEFLVYVVAKREQQKADSMVFRLPDNVLAGICNTILHKGGRLNTQSVSDEYLSKRSFYDGMIQYSKPHIERIIVTDDTLPPSPTPSNQITEERRAE